MAVDFMVCDWTTGERVGLGLKKFKVTPVVGDIISVNDKNGIGQAYKVIARILPLDDPDAAGDLELVRISDLLGYYGSIRNSLKMET
ncbi:MAG: hypothetical protein WCF85_01990 [Rhodospirillaceae bacterium]